MKNILNISFFTLLVCLSVTGEDSKHQFNGTWCVGSDGLVLTFFDKDSLRVGNASDESVQGDGVFKSTDSTFSATVKNGDVVMEMKYRYCWKGADTVSAQAVHLTVNGDSVQFPVEWMEMMRCSIKK